MNGTLIILTWTVYTHRLNVPCTDAPKELSP